MLGWWYSRGWLWIGQIMRSKLSAIAQIFAVSILLKTLFAPWKQIYSPTTFRTFFRDMVDNAVSRTIGAVVRGIILFWAGTLSLLVVLAGVVSLVIWPFLPLLIIILPILAISGVSL